MELREAGWCRPCGVRLHFGFFAVWQEEFVQRVGVFRLRESRKRDVAPLNMTELEMGVHLRATI